MADVLSRAHDAQETSALEPVAVQGWRSPPQAVRLLLPVWGYSYVRQFLECGLPTLLAPGNVPALAAVLPTEFVILTSADDEAFIREHATFRRLAATCKVRIHRIDHLITDGNYSTTITLAYTEAVRATGDAAVDTCFFFLVADYIVADGSLANALRRMQRGTSAVLVGNFQVAREDAMPWLQDKLASARHALAVPSRELMQWALNHLHPATLANTVNIPFSHNSHTNRLFWRVDGSTIVGRFYLMHMLCVRPETTDFIIGSSCDYSFIPEMCPSGNVEAMTDSDEYLAVEMQPRDHESSFLQPGPLKPSVLAKSLNEWATKDHRSNARHCVLFHAGELPAQLDRTLAEANSFVGEVARKLKPEPVAHRDHPYWRGAIAAFRDATGHKLKQDEWRYVLGLPATSDWLTDWLLWRAKYALLGRPPHVLPWHPAWPDFQTVLDEIEPFLNDPTRRLLMLSNEPTPFTVALADSGERVQRLRITPFQQNPPERYEPMLGKFDLCLLELNEGAMKNGDELLDRVVPLMKDGGRIIIFVPNRRSMSNAGAFGHSVSFHGARFFRAGALPTDIYFVPASRIRWMARRGMLHLRGWLNRRLFVGVPAAIVAGGFLLCLSLIGNLDSLRRRRRVTPRGITSSLIMRLTVDARRTTDGHAYSRSEMERRKKRRSETLAKLIDAPLSDVADQARASRKERCIELQNTIGLAPLGLLTNQLWHDDPRSLASHLARYKFVAKMLGGRREAAEIGCGDAFGTRVVQQEVPNITVYDADSTFIDDIRARQDERWPLEAAVHDIVAAPLPRKHDALFSLDGLEYVAREDEDAYLRNLRDSLTDSGVLVIGTLSGELQIDPSEASGIGRINSKRGNELKVLLDNYFDRVFLFSMADELVQPGCHPMAHYFFAVCTGAKREVVGAGRYG